MIKIQNILGLINDSLATHYFKDITFHKVVELVKSNEDEDEKERPHVYDGHGNYTFIQDDTNGLTVYHRIINFENDEDLESGWGRNSLTTEKYEIKTVFYGQQPAIENDDCDDINFYLAKEFKKLVPRKLSLVDINRIVVTSIDYEKEKIANDEGLENVPESVLFSLTLNITLKSTENCNTVDCGTTEWEQCSPVVVTNSDGIKHDVASGGAFVCDPISSDIFLKFHWDASTDITDTATIDSDSAGVYTIIADDGGSGTVTVSVNGGGYVAFSTLNPLTLVAADTIAFTRTTTTSAGWVKLTGTY